MLRSGAPGKGLRRRLNALLPTPDMLGPCQLRYARFGPGRKLTAYYDALVHIEGTKGYCARPVAVTWGSDGHADRHHGTADLAEIQTEAVSHGVAAPVRQLVADVPAWDMHIEVSPLDARIPQLVRSSDPRSVRDVIACAYAASDLAAALGTPAPPRLRRGAVLGARRGGSPRPAPPAPGGCPPTENP